jgi:tRNA threonylcarbamoyladenosine biosynthesis protein TsaB
MKTVAIDTSLSRGSVAALDDDRLAVRWLEPAGEHARLLAAVIADAAAELGWRPADVDLVAVVRGPGSFTGLRVGVTTAKAFAWATGCRLLGISGFEAIARVAGATLAGLSGGSPELHVAYDAGRGDVFTATATPAPAAPSGWVIGPASLSTADAWVRGLPPGAIVSGPAVPILAGPLAGRPDLVVAPPAARVSTAADVAAIAALRAAAGEGDAPAELVPEYMRPSYADEAARG